MSPIRPTTDFNDPYCPHDKSVARASDRQGPFTYEFMVPEEKDDYGSGTTFIRVPTNPIEIEKTFIVEQVIIFFVRYDVEKKETFLLERRIWAD